MTALGQLFTQELGPGLKVILCMCVNPMRYLIYFTYILGGRILEEANSFVIPTNDELSIGPLITLVLCKTMSMAGPRQASWQSWQHNTPATLSTFVCNHSPPPSRTKQIFARHSPLTMGWLAQMMVFISTILKLNRLKGLLVKACQETYTYFRASVVSQSSTLLLRHPFL